MFSFILLLTPYVYLFYQIIFWEGDRRGGSGAVGSGSGSPALFPLPTKIVLFSTLRTWLQLTIGYPGLCKTCQLADLTLNYDTRMVIPFHHLFTVFLRGGHCTIFDTGKRICGQVASSICNILSGMATEVWPKVPPQLYQS
jgi:hypothetical protein